MTADRPTMVEVLPKAILAIDLIAQSQQPLLEDEESLIRDATAARTREIRAGRTVGRRAMERLGIQPGVILSGIGGEPTWPMGVCGSLTHTRSHVGALVARSAFYASLGVDLDDERRLGQKVAEEIAIEEELALMQEWPPIGHGLCPEAANAVFCAKEAIFKCQYNITQCAELDFGDVVLRSGGPTGHLAACARSHLPTAVRDVVAKMAVRLLNIQGLTVACALISR